MPRRYNIVLYGASGFVGRQTVACASDGASDGVGTGSGLPLNRQTGDLTPKPVTPKPAKPA